MTGRRFVSWLAGAVFIWLAACGEPAVQPVDIPGSGPERGNILFQLNPLGTAPGCATCHSLDPDEVLVGPSLASLATLAADQETGLSTEAYLRQALLEPDAYLRPDFNPGAMPAYGNILAEADINDLVAYLLTLE